MKKTTPQKKSRKCKREKQEHAEVKNARICIPVDHEQYEKNIDDAEWFRHYLDDCRMNYPELFPEILAKGYKCVGFCRISKKMPQVPIRRIRSKAKNTEGKTETYQVFPCFVMPYMTGYTSDVEKALFLHFKYEVPFEGLARTFGRNVDYWYRMTEAFGRYNIAETTTKKREVLPKHLTADEKHTKWNGHRAYIVTTVGEGCFWGASISLGANEKSFLEAYNVFKKEVQQVDKEYVPQTVNTDGFKSTLKAWTTLFESTVLIRCFLHGFLKIRNSAKRLPIFEELAEKVWNAYREESYEGFINEMTLLQFWSEKQQEKGQMSKNCFNAVLKLCNNAHEYARAYEHPMCHRTSNMLDRLMQKMDRYLFMMRYFHGDMASAEFNIRGWGLAQNFLPYCSRSERSKEHISPVHRLNGMVYHKNWLENLLISTSSIGTVKRTQS